MRMRRLHFTKFLEVTAVSIKVVRISPKNNNVCKLLEFRMMKKISLKNLRISSYGKDGAQDDGDEEYAQPHPISRGVRTLDPEHAGPSNKSKLSMEGAGTPGTPRRKEGAQRKSFFRTLRRKLNTIKGKDPNAYKALYS